MALEDRATLKDSWRTFKDSFDWFWLWVFHCLLIERIGLAGFLESKDWRRVSKWQWEKDR